VLKRGGVAMCGTPGLYPVHPSPLDCWRILPDGYAALFPAQFWTTLTCGMWGDRERLMYELQDGGAFPDGPPETSVADAMKDATYREGCDGRFPIMVWWVGVKR
jgi:hypothetical protein